jgi:hypothetical protein
VNLQLRPRIFAQLKPGARVVSHEFDFGAWKPDAQRRLAVPDKPYGPPSSMVYLWIVPANAAGRWRGQIVQNGKPLDYDATFEQTFQALSGSAQVAGKPARVENPRVRGEDIAYTLVASIDGREARYELSGRIAGESMEGKARAPGGSAEASFRAARVARGRMTTDTAAEQSPF